MRVTSIESSVNLTYQWLHELKDFGDFKDESQCYSVLRVIFHALRDKLPTEISSHLASQLPLVLKGVYYDGWVPSKPMTEARAFEEFLSPMAHELRNINVNGRDAVVSAIQFIIQKLEPGLTEKILHALPAHIREHVETKE
ncbi:Uncharacterized conserved protein (DUF2267) [Legionella lansingensis]|uniref:DUF2267 domain-containing protein n=1 Tax=Legionella lansingensis TaxID=45067 RepID=A0A0W0VQD6_9GAMM|nr:DUF2267 domain-containing protein [Legionella lansingensis]KTD22280.1 hypothetical protein Llan_1221 [Legionella lansingensis]SNV50632.1 Uncharacterized conserved protein (DUF2267) [Legionella lansingensis]